MKGRAIALLRPSPRPPPAAAWCPTLPYRQSLIDQPLPTAASSSQLPHTFRLPMHQSGLSSMPGRNPWLATFQAPTSDHCSLCSRRRRARSQSPLNLLRPTGRGETLMSRRVSSNERKTLRRISPYIRNFVSATRARLSGAWGSM